MDNSKDKHLFLGMSHILLGFISEHLQDIEGDSFNYNLFILPTIAVIIIAIVILIAIVVCRCNMQHFKSKHNEMSLKPTPNSSECDSKEYQMPSTNDEEKHLPDTESTPSCDSPTPDVDKSNIKKNVAYAALMCSSNSEYADPRSLQSRARQVLHSSEMQSVEAYAITNL